MPLAAHHCKNEYQDTKYGAQVRVVNPIDKSRQNGVPQRYRCTVCGGDVDKQSIITKSR